MKKRLPSCRRFRGKEAEVEAAIQNAAEAENGRCHRRAGNGEGEDVGAPGMGTDLLLRHTEPKGEDDLNSPGPDHPRRDPMDQPEGDRRA